jgi:hypothetical protein
VEAANAEAVRRILAAKPTVVGIGIARDVVPGMAKDLILHAGPPVTWEKMCGPLRGAVMGGLMYEGLQRPPKRPRSWRLRARYASIPAITTMPWALWPV